MLHSKKLHLCCAYLRTLINLGARVFVTVNGQMYLCLTLDDDDDMIDIIARNYTTSEEFQFRVSEGYSAFTVRLD